MNHSPTTSIEAVLRYLDLYAEMSNLDPGQIHAVYTMRDGEEMEGVLRPADLRQILAERREAIERLSALTADARLVADNAEYPLGEGVLELAQAIDSSEKFLSEIGSDA